jgi:hypothetical protein
MTKHRNLSEDFLQLLEEILNENRTTFKQHKVQESIESFILENLEKSYSLRQIKNVMLEEIEGVQHYLYESNQLNENHTVVLEGIKDVIKGVAKAPFRAAGYVKGLSDRIAGSAGRAYGSGYASGRGSRYTGSDDDEYDSTPEPQQRRPGVRDRFASGRMAGEADVIARRQPTQPRGAERVTMGSGQTPTGGQQLTRQTGSSRMTTGSGTSSQSGASRVTTGSARSQTSAARPTPSQPRPGFSSATRARFDQRPTSTQTYRSFQQRARAARVATQQAQPRTSRPRPPVMSTINV